MLQSGLKWPKSWEFKNKETDGYGFDYLFDGRIVSINVNWKYK